MESIDYKLFQIDLENSDSYAEILVTSGSSDWGRQLSTGENANLSAEKGAQ